jgi:hypothetical protein
MSNTYTFKIDDIQVLESQNGNQDVVQNVSWTLFGEDSQNKVSVWASTPIKYNESGSFIPYDQLTESQVIEWVKAEIGDMLKLHYGVIDSKLAKMAQKPVEAEVIKTPVPKQLPWVRT